MKTIYRSVYPPTICVAELEWHTLRWFNKHSEHRKKQHQPQPPPQLNLPLKSVWPPPPYPLHTASPARSCPPRHSASQTASCTPLRLTASLRSHLLCTSRGKSEARGTADPAADSHPIPSPSRAETTCSWGWRGPSSRSARRSPNSACEPNRIATFLARTWRNSPRR